MALNIAIDRRTPKPREVAWVLVLAALLVSCGKKGGTTIKVDGSSTVYPITEAVAEEFRKSGNKNVQVTVGI